MHSDEILMANLSKRCCTNGLSQQIMQQYNISIIVINTDYEFSLKIATRHLHKATDSHKASLTLTENSPCAFYSLFDVTFYQGI